ncbi:MAG TPA: hypothetical protein DDW27_02955, partial [Bacteroidales bacterium]|nr:hypothetical protein [Bacteroidales bacterium]
MNRITITVILLLATFSPGFGETYESIRKFIDDRTDGSSYKIDNEKLLCGKELQLFYVNRFYDPAWFTLN